MKNNNSIVTLKPILAGWASILVFSSCILILILNLTYYNSQARKTTNIELKVISLGYQLKSYSDYLTTEARKFSFNQNPRNLQNYLNETLINKNRYKIIQQLKSAKLNKQTSHYLVEAKRNSDLLTSTETRSMYLILSAYNTPLSLYPVSIKQYSPTPHEKNLSPQAKIKLARSILFDQKYVKIKETIMQPINKFQSDVIFKTKQQLKEERNLINILTFLLTLLSIINITLSTTLIWRYLRKYSIE